jgi:hypothetical protein
MYGALIGIRLDNAPPDDGDCTETCRSCFNVNFNLNFKIVFKTIHLCISWWIEKTLIISRCSSTVCVWEFIYSVVARKYVGIVEHDRAWKDIQFSHSLNLRVSYLQ